MKIYYGLILVIITHFSFAYAEEFITRDYNRAYQYCTPIARQKTIEKCNYGKLVETQYLQCMKEKGFRDEDDMSDNSYYQKYLESHKKCNVSANYAAQRECNFGKLYQIQYNICMLELGFNEDGEKIASPKPNNSPTNDSYKEDPSDYQEPKRDTRSFLGKLSDSILP